MSSLLEWCVLCSEAYDRLKVVDRSETPGPRNKSTDAVANRIRLSMERNAYRPP